MTDRTCPRCKNELEPEDTTRCPWCGYGKEEWEDREALRYPWYNKVHAKGGKHGANTGWNKKADKHTQQRLCADKWAKAGGTQW